MSWRPDITVAAVAARGQQFLIVEERIKDQAVFNQPAGHVEGGESLLAAVIRETREETAWQFTPEWLIGVYLWRNPRTRHDTLRFAFGGTVSGHNASHPLDAPIIATHWLTRAELEARNAQLRTPLVLRCIDDFLHGARLPLNALVEYGAHL
jgi:8-oxo-dGTP pyrophosphatase MutT (NUDIX family)